MSREIFTVVKIFSTRQRTLIGVVPVAKTILLAGQKRLRPIVMNTVTTIFGMLPMMVYPGTGTEFYRPLAVAVIFGLAFATALTLVVVPVVVWMMERKRERERG